jgi:hypothetical protein
VQLRQPMGSPMSPCRRRVDVRYARESARTAQPAQTTLRKGLPISTPEQTLLDLAVIGVGLVDLVVVADCMIKAGHTSPERLVEAAGEWSGRGCRLARRAASLARPGVDSPQESGLRFAARAGRASGADCQFDHSWPRRQLAQALRPGVRALAADYHLRLVIEYDGRRHAEDSRQWLADIFRREELDQMRWRLVIVTSEGIYRDPLRTLERVRDALLECGATGIRRTFKPQWKLHFPVR